MNIANSQFSEITNIPKTIYARLGTLEVRLARNAEETKQAIAVRARVFSGVKQFNEDRFDGFCEHLLVLDNSLDDKSETGRVVATYRLLNNDRAKQSNGFYSQQEFDLSNLLEKNIQMLELGRSCVLPEYRSKRTMELLWAGTWAYVLENSIELMFGCASFEGTQPSNFKEALSFLKHHAPAENDWHVEPLKDLAITTELKDKSDLDIKKAMREMPTIIKGYLRLGAMFSVDAVIDHQFGTTDVLVVLPVERINPRYIKYYGQDAERHIR